MLKDFAVVFTANNARMIYAEDLNLLKEYQNVVIHPDLSQVKGFPPHFWKYVNGFIVPMDEAEQKARLEHIAQHGIESSPDVRMLSELEQKRIKEEKAAREARLAADERLQKQAALDNKEYIDFQDEQRGCYVNLKAEVSHLQACVIEAMQQLVSLRRHGIIVGATAFLLMALMYFSHLK